MIYKIIKKIPFLSLIIISLYLGSCIYSPPQTKKTILKQNIVVSSNTDKIVVDGKSLATTALGVSSYILNKTKKYHEFTLHTLPTLVTKSSVAYSDVNITLDNYTYNDLKTKDFFLILSNTSNSTDKNVAIHNSILRTIVMPDDDISNIIEQAPFTLRNTTPLINNYENFDTATSGTTKRSMMFFQTSENKNEKYTKTQTTLFKKIKQTIRGKDIKILIWIAEGTDTANAQTILDTFKDDFFTGNNGTSIYEMLYVLNGEKHFWGQHSANNITQAEELHIGFGTLPGSTVGFISIPQFFTNTKESSKESVIAPTMYLPSIVLTQNNNKQLLFAFYTTFLHELQHISHLYNRNVSKYPGNDIATQINLGDGWFSEFTAIITEQVLLYALLKKLDITSDIFHYTVGSRGTRKGFIQFNRYLYQYPFLGNISLKIYDIHQIFSTYILANYGADVIANLMNNNTQRDFKVNGEALFDAISESAYSNTFYQDYAQNKQPQSFDDIINDFYVANLLSEVPFSFSTSQNSSWLTAGPTKMLVYNNLNNAAVINSNEIASIVSDLPIKKSELNTILGNNNKFVTYNLAFSPSLDRDGTYTSFAQNDAEINFNQFWLQGAGPIFSSKTTINSTQNRPEHLHKGSGAYLYLGGKSSQKQNASSFSFTKPSSKEIQDKVDIKLTLDIQIPKGTSTTLVIMEEK